MKILATLSRKVAHDCPDLIPVKVTFEVNGYFDAFDCDCTVTEAVQDDNGVEIYSAGEPLRYNNMNELNLQQLERAFRDEMSERRAYRMELACGF